MVIGQVEHVPAFCQVSARLHHRVYTVRLGSVWVGWDSLANLYNMPSL